MPRAEHRPTGSGENHYKQKCEKAAFVADTDREFRELRPSIRDTLRETETLFRIAMNDMINAFPAHLAEVLGATMVTTLPAQFIRALLPFFVGLSELEDYREVFEKYETRKHEGKLQ